MADFIVENVNTPASIDTFAGFKYLEHPSDVIFHGFGNDLK